MPDVSQDPRYIKVVADVAIGAGDSAAAARIAASASSISRARSSTRSRKRDVEILTLLASQAAVAIENARLYEDGPRQRGAAREGAALRAARAGGAAAGRAAEAAEGRRRRGALRRRRASSAATSTISWRPSRTAWSSPSATCRARACRRRSTARLPRELVRGRTFRRRYLPERSTPAGVLASMNTILHQRQLEEYYCTLCYAVFDFKRRIVTLANSGLPYPDPRVRRQRSRRSSCPACRSDRFPASTYDEVTFALHTGDLFVFCTDGVFEAMNAKGQEFSAARLLDVVAQVRDLAAARRSSTRSSRPSRSSAADAPPNDDMTAVAVRITT